MCGGCGDVDGIGVIHDLVGVHEPVWHSWNISGGRLSRPASSVSDDVVVIVVVVEVARWVVHAEPASWTESMKRRGSSYM